MFGSKNKENLEKIETLSKELEHKEEVYSAVASNAIMMENNFQEYNESTEHMQKDLNQIAENLDASAAILSGNNKLISAMHNTVAAGIEDAQSWDSSMDAFLAKLKKSADNSMNAVENNKHFTEPSRTVSDFADFMKKDGMENLRELKLMAEYSKQMGVLALNAAIEAGRMGESGAQFVSAAESVRNYANNYDKSVRGLLERYEESQKQIAELEEAVRLLVSLLKDNNVAVSKVMKELNDLTKEATELKSAAPVGLYSELADSVSLLHDAEAEVDRIEARNKMQLEDIMSETELQQKNIREISEVLSSAIDMTK